MDGVWDGAKLRELRLAVGMSQQELASLSGTSQPNVARWETSQIEPSYSHALALAHVLGVGLLAFRADSESAPTPRRKKR